MKKYIGLKIDIDWGKLWRNEQVLSFQTTLHTKSALGLGVEAWSVFGWGMECSGGMECLAVGHGMESWGGGMECLNGVLLGMEAWMSWGGA